jgi:GLPGLI family protein
MKLFFSFVTLLLTSTTIAQPAIVTQAIVNTTTTVIAPEEEEVQNIQNPQGGGMNFRNMMDGEFKFTTYLKNNMVKHVIKSEMGRSTIIRDNEKKSTITLLEIMGNKNGFVITDAEQDDLKRKRDSMLMERRKNDSSVSQQMPLSQPQPAPEIAYTEETRKIAGYTCKKAYVISTRLLGLKDTALIWFTPEIKLPNLAFTGGIGGIGPMSNMGMSLEGVDNLEGFVMRFEMKLRRNRKMEVEVTKIDLKKEIPESEFNVPKDFDVKPASEMQNMFNQFRRNN